MIPWALLDRAEIPGGSGELRLMRRGAEFSIMLGTVELMNSRRGGSEEALATVACSLIRERHRPQILIGGLGMGFTLRAALAGLGGDAGIVVAELLPAVVAWARGPMTEIFSGSLEDARVRIQEEDVGLLIRSTKSAYDAILLDVDNGPDGIVRDANNRIYSRTGLAKARDALAPGGILAVWSAGPDPAFRKRLHDTGLDIVEWKTRSRPNNKGAHHIIWFARKA